ncbi:MAG: endospore germination permease [Syntrophomonadaceae bacterium]|nr:endospore germination permease [Syntrophomonadaceae bacterium]
MLDNGRISSVQLVLVVTMAEIATVFLIVPAVTAGTAGPDGWMAVLLPATAYGLLVATVCVALARRFPAQVFTGYLPQVLGWLPGKLLAAAYTFFFAHVNSLILTQGTQFIHTAFLRDTPVLVLALVLAGAAAYGVYLDIEVIARQNELVFVVFVLSFVILVTLVAREVSIDNLKPVLENGLVPMVRGGMVPAAWRGEVFVILMLFPYLNQKEEALPSAIMVVVLVGLLAGTVTATTIGVFGAPLTSRLVFPVFNLAQYISVADILQRMEILLVIMWIGGVIVKLAVFYHTASIAAATTLGLKSYKPAIIPVAITSIVISEVFYGTYLQTVNLLTGFFPFYAYTFELLLPALVLLAAVLRHKGGTHHGGDI